MNTVWKMKKQQPLTTQCQTGVVSVSQKTTTSNIATINNSYTHAKSHPIKYTDPDWRSPKDSITLINGTMIASYKKMDFDIGFSKGTTVWASEGMNLSIAPGSKTKLNIDGLGKNINKKLWGVAIYNIVDVQRDVIFKLEQFIL